jgi:hypothetical protein
LINQYRAAIRPHLITSALIEEILSRHAIAENFALFYSYLDLCNEQVFLRMHGRVRRRTWLLWCDGTRGNLNRSGFKESWAAVRWRTDDFNELRLLCDSGFADPRSFQPWWRRHLHRELTVERVGLRMAREHRARWRRLTSGGAIESERQEHEFIEERSVAR